MSADSDKEMMARVLKGQEHLTVEQQLRNVCEGFSIVQADNKRLYALADKQDDELEQLRAAAQPTADTIAKPSVPFTSNERTLLKRARELLGAFRHAYEPNNPFPLLEEIDRFLESSPETTAEPAERELFSQVGQLIAGWKQGCTPAEWSDFDEQVLRSWQAWRVAQMPPCPRDDLPSACGERFGPGGHHECRLQPNHDDACKCSCGAIRS